MIAKIAGRIPVYFCILACALLYAADEDTWIEVDSPNFTIVSDASVKQARRVAKNLEQFRVVFRSAFPNLRMDSGSKLVVFAVRNEKSLDALIPSDYRQKGAAQPAGIFMSGPERGLVVLRTDVPADESYHVVYHEYVHMLMNLNFRSLPLWLSEGLAELLGYTTVMDGTSELGKYSPDLLQVLKTSRLIPLTTLLAVTRDSPYYHEQDKVTIFYAQSWALAHYLMLGEKQAHLKQLNEFLRLIEDGSAQEEAIERVFGSPASMQRDLEKYIRLFAFYYGRIPTKLDVKEDQYGARTLSRAESLAARGEVLVYSERLDEAREMLEQALRLDPQSPSANLGMGALFLKLGENDQAQKYFSAAAELDSRSYLAQFFAAQSAYERGENNEKVEGYLRKAIEINPQFAPAYDVLSHILAAREGKLPEALELANRAAKLEPSELSHRVNAGRILIRMGRIDEACNLANGMLALAQTDAERAQAESLLFHAEEQRRAAKEANARADAGWRAADSITEEPHPATGGFADQQETQVEEGAKRTGLSTSKIQAGPPGKLRGLIRSVRCEDPAVMDLTLDSNGVQHRLRAENFYQVQYWAVDAPGKTGFDPCGELEGKRVEIEFLSVAGQEFSGIIRTVAIQK